MLPYVSCAVWGMPKASFLGRSSMIQWPQASLWFSAEHRLIARPRVRTGFEPLLYCLQSCVVPLYYCRGSSESWLELVQYLGSDCCESRSSRRCRSWIESSDWLSSFAQKNRRPQSSFLFFDWQLCLASRTCCRWIWLECGIAETTPSILFHAILLVNGLIALLTMHLIQTPWIRFLIGWNEDEFFLLVIVSCRMF